MPMTDEEKETALRQLTQVLDDALEVIGGEGMQFVLFALPKVKPKNDGDKAGILCGNTPARDVSRLLRLAAVVASPEDIERASRPAEKTTTH